MLFGEMEANRLCPSALDLLGFANSVHTGRVGKIIMALPTAGPTMKETVEDMAELISGASLHPVDLVILENPAFEHPHPPLLGVALKSLALENKAEMICLPHSMLYCQVAATVATGLGATVVTGVERLGREGEQITFERSLMNGKWKATVSPRSARQVVTLNSGAFAKDVPERKRGAKVTVMKRDFLKTDRGYPHLGMRWPESGTCALEKADAIVAAGRGMTATPQGLDLVRRAVGIFKNAALGSSRPLCDAQMLPFACQIGETGRRVAPGLYLACGISGAPQHLAGMNGSRCVVAVNTDPEAPIFNRADYGVIADAGQFLALLVKKYDERMERGRQIKDI